MITQTPRKEAWVDYQNQFDADFYKYIISVLEYLERNFAQGEVKSPDHLSLMLDELPAYYESFATWLARRRGDLDKLATEYDVQFAEAFMDYKKQGNTNEVSRMLAKSAMAEKRQEINEAKKAWYMVEALKKSIAHYVDSTRSQLSYEKQQQMYGGGK